MVEEGVADDTDNSRGKSVGLLSAFWNRRRQFRRTGDERNVKKLNAELSSSQDGIDVVNQQAERRGSTSSSLSNLLRRLRSFSWFGSLSLRSANSNSSSDESFEIKEERPKRSVHQNEAEVGFGLNANYTKHNIVPCKFEFARSKIITEFKPTSVLTQIVDKRNYEVVFNFEIPKACLMNIIEADLTVHLASEVNRSIRGIYCLFIGFETYGVVLGEVERSNGLDVTSYKRSKGDDPSWSTNVYFVFTDELKEIVQNIKFQKKGKGLRLSLAVRRRKVLTPESRVEICDVVDKFLPAFVSIHWYCDEFFLSNLRAKDQ